MKLAKCFLILGLCILMGSCPTEDNDIDIYIGDYENQLVAWNNQNILDYQLLLINTRSGNSKRAFITVKNGISESSDPPEWIASGEKSTVTEFFSFIKEEEKRLRGGRSMFDESGYFTVRYDTKYYYPRSIDYAYSTTASDKSPDWSWSIMMTPLVENEQEAWNNQDMSNYKLSLYYYYNSRLEWVVITVKNGIPESSDPPEWIASGEKSTIPEFFSFIKEEEKRLENVRASKEGYFEVIYDPVYYYPCYITTTDYTGAILSGKDYRWCISLSSLGD